MSTPSSRLRESRVPLLLYNLVYPFVLIAMLPGFILRMLRRGNYRHKFGQRFGIYSARVRARALAGRAEGWTWVHAVSVGESIIALKLIDEMKRRHPELRVVLATTTSTGFTLARQTAAQRDWMEVIYNPLDFIIPVHRALGLFQPRRLILIEAEVWPNMVATSVRRGLPVFLVNARLSPRSGARYAQARRLTGPVFRLLTGIFLTEEEERPRWIKLGARPEQLTLTGSIKFDQPPASTTTREAEFRHLLTTLGFPENGPILVGGSTFEGEELILARAFQELQPDFPDLRLILVPRHFERTDAILRTLAPLGLRIARRTTVSSSQLSTLNPQLFLIDTTGELRDWYRLATVAFIGKSLLSHGGQNPVEPVMAGAPVICGPHMQNFAALMQHWKRDQAVIEIRDTAELTSALRRLLRDPAERQRLVQRATATVESHQGATARSADCIFAENKA